MTDDECILCRILRREAPGSWVYEHDRVAVILTIGPVTPGHAMVLPKAHVPLLADLPEDDARHLFVVTQRAAEAIRRSSPRAGYRGVMTGMVPRLRKRIAQAVLPRGE